MYECYLIFIPVIYIFIMLFTYWLYNKIDPYDEETDYCGEGDLNKGAATIWPISLPIFIFCGIIAFFSKIMDFIRKW